MRDCICADPENCTQEVPGYRCRKGEARSHPSSGDKVCMADGLEAARTIVAQSSISPDDNLGEFLRLSKLAAEALLRAQSGGFGQLVGGVLERRKQVTALDRAAAILVMQRCPDTARTLTTLAREIERSDVASAVVHGFPADKWIGCQECDEQFICHNGEHGCIRLYRSRDAESASRDL